MRQAPDVTLAERLLQVRHELFVGRQSELQLVSAWLANPQVPYAVVYLTGPGGVGKTTLLSEMAWLCRAAGVSLKQLDAASLDATPAAFTGAALGTGGQDFRVLLVDTFEELAPLDRWFVEHFLGLLAANTLVVVAGRLPPSPAWRLNAPVLELTRHVALANFNADESEQYLSRRRVPQHHRPSILAFTHGHPLAVALAADTVLQKGDQVFKADSEPNLVKTLLDHFIVDIPTASHRAALEACALIHRTREELLFEMVCPERPEEAHALFEWLRGLSFMESRSDGMYPHDIVRDVLSADLRWRHRDWYNELHARARRWYHRRLGERTNPRDVFDLMYLHRDSPMVKPFLDWKATSDLLVDRFRADDAAALQDMVRQHEGSAAAELVAAWLARCPQGFQVLRDSVGVRGFFLEIPLRTLPEAPAEEDPGVAAVLSFLREQAPLQGGEEAIYCRFWMDRAGYQGVSPVQSRIFLNQVLQALSSSQLAFSAMTVAMPDFWAPIFAYACAERLPCDFQVDGRTYGVFYHDWRQLPPTKWLELLAEREVNPAPQAAVTAPRPAGPGLTREQFDAAVKEGLKHFVFAEQLTDNPLLGARFIVEACGAQASPLERARMLQKLLSEAASSLQKTPRDAKLYRSLHVTYLEPAENQELAAQHLDVPFSTYRRHLTAGIARVQSWLWQRR